MVESPGEYKWSSYNNYIKNEDNLVSYNPEYLGLSKNEEERTRLYIEYIGGNILEKRSEERFFKVGVYGSTEYIKEMMKKGLKPKWSRRGRPRNKRDEK